MENKARDITYEEEMLINFMPYFLENWKGTGKGGYWDKENMNSTNIMVAGEFLKQYKPKFTSLNEEGIVKFLSEQTGKTIDEVNDSEPFYLHQGQVIELIKKFLPTHEINEERLRELLISFGNYPVNRNSQQWVDDWIKINLPYLKSVSLKEFSEITEEEKLQIMYLDDYTESHDKQMLILMATDILSGERKIKLNTAVKIHQYLQKQGYKL